MSQWIGAHTPRARGFYRPEGRRSQWEFFHESPDDPAKLTIKNHRFCVEVFPFEEYAKIVGKDKVTDAVKNKEWVLVAMLKRHEGDWELAIPAFGMEKFPAGFMALETYGSRVKFNTVQITARFDEDWLRGD
jgi:hypothetical protein